MASRCNASVCCSWVETRAYSPSRILSRPPGQKPPAQGLCHALHFPGEEYAVLPWQKTRVFRQAPASLTYSQARGVHAMVTSDATSLPEPLLPFRRRPPTLVLPADPSEEELVQCWTLSSQDKEEIYKCRGEAQRRRFAV